MSEPIPPTGPELQTGVAVSDVPEGGMLRCRVGDEPVLLLERSGRLYAISAACSHYGAPLADGAFIGTTVRCPWHHACFDVKTGEAVGPPALRPIDTWNLVREGNMVRTNGKTKPLDKTPSAAGPTSVVIVGAGAAGDATAEMLRRLGYLGPITLVSGDGEGLPVDRPNLSKDYLDGSAPEEWIPLRSAEFYRQERITLLDAKVVRIDPARREVTLADEETLPYAALVLATGSSPVRLDLPGASLPHVHVLRTLGDSRAVIQKAETSKRVVVLGSSFIGLEVAASLRKRGLEVHVVSPDQLPLARILGTELGAFVRGLHEERGVVFHLGRKPAAISESAVVLDDGSSVPADLVVMGVGVRPNVALAEAAGLTVKNGIVVDAEFRTSAPDVFAAGDVARYPTPEGDVRIEHWVVAQRQGQMVARTLLGQGRGPRWVPFFWSQHYDVAINYVGHAERWDSMDVVGNVPGRDCLVAYRQAGRIVAVVTVGRDQANLLAEEALIHDDQAALEALLSS